MNTRADSITGMKLVKTELEDKEFVIVNTNMDDGDDENSIIVQHEIDLHRESGGAIVQDDGVATDKCKLVRLVIRIVNRIMETHFCLYYPQNL